MSDDQSTDDLIALAARQLEFLGSFSGDELSPKASHSEVVSIIDAARDAGITAAMALSEVIDTLSRTRTSPVTISNSHPLIRRVVHRDDSGKITEVVDEPLRRSK